jgi:hypothetical protein
MNRYENCFTFLFIGHIAVKKEDIPDERYPTLYLRAKPTR